MVLAALAWWMPSLRSFNPSDSLVVIPVVSVILSARAAPWRRRLTYAGAILGTFVAINFVFAYSGLMAEVGQHIGADLFASTVGVIYMVFSFAVPLGALLMFVGRDPSMLWAKPAALKRRKTSGTARRI